MPNAISFVLKRHKFCVTVVVWEIFGRTAGVGMMVGGDGDGDGDGNGGPRCRWNDEDFYRTWEAGTLSYEACAGVKGLALYFSNLASLRSDDAGNRGSRARRDTTIDPPPMPYYGREQGCGEGGLPSGEVSEQTRIGISSSPSSYAHPLLETQVLQAYKHMQTAEKLCTDFLVPRLQACPNVRMLRGYGTGGDHVELVPIVSFVHGKIHSRRIVDTVLREGIVIRQGTFLANDVLLKCLGLSDGIVRISFCHYNTVEETRRLLQVLESIDGWW